MANIYISYSQKDNKVVDIMINRLKELGHTILTANYHLKLEISLPRSIVYEDIRELVHKSEVAIVVFTENYIDSDHRFESNTIISYAKNENKLIIPIVIGDVLPPNSYFEINWARISSNRIDELHECIKKIEHVISVFESKITEIKEQEETQKEEKQKVVKRVIESQVLKDVLFGLRMREIINKFIALLFYILTVGLLVGAARLAYYTILDTVKDIKDTNLYYYIYIGLKNLVIIGLLITSSRYSFKLGQVLMREGVRQGDRLHAINYGKFFLSSFQDRLSFEEMKDLFKDWNIDNNKESKGTVVDDMDSVREIDTKTTGEIVEQLCKLGDQFGKIGEMIAKMKK
ncbi:TIR domain-containing protein [Aneurinibacillus soli]|uniref:TIR domain protein n=1 Tax=Aneurinibacillus soli TaxID=1500254 RepID=A0A0U5CA46_9BACL|nr:toll/interleukin-1 receptor domain-containing protein [Aneurinibacillus soli]PYE58654.1 TIR domain-containing protein [Aneurinibacillus soli]BAU29587.1 TIR domain protein [Aneurinibacillus soli]